MKEQRHYDTIDGLRTIACIGIIMMHVQANSAYQISGFIYEKVIPSFTNFVFLFMSVSAFGMCCGYYGKILQGNVDFVDFYKKRFLKVLPFFSILVLLDFIVSPSKDALYEVFANITLLFGLLPDAGNISIIGVGWFLGILFVFYLIFPFFCVLIGNKKRGWISFIISLIYNFLCVNYFYVGRKNILYCACFFVLGGVIFLYKEAFIKVNRFILWGIVLFSIFFYYNGEETEIKYLIMSASLLVFSISGGRHQLLANKITKFISGISLEIYLSHMMIFRILEKIGFIHVLGNEKIQYGVTVIVVLLGSMLFAVIMQSVLENVMRRFKGLNHIR